MSEAKTNAMRMLDREKIPYNVHTYDNSDGKIDGPSVAAKIGQDPKRVWKTLVTKGSSGGYFVFVLPVELDLDLKKAAKAVGEKSVSMIRVDEINRVTGYIRGGCSPVGMKKAYPTTFDSRVGELPTILVSGGRIGVQIEIEPSALLKAVNGQTGDLTV